MTEAQKPKAKFSDFFDHVSLVMFGLGFAAGMPNLLAGANWALGTWMREAGIGLALIGIMGLVTISYALKFIWAPLVDRIGIPVLDGILGRRRAWMLVTQILATICLIVLSTIDPQTNFKAFAATAAVLAFVGSNQDIAIDAWRIEVSPSEEKLGILTTMYQFGYRLAFIVAGAVPLYISQYFNGNDYAQKGWSIAYLAMAGLMIFPIIATLNAPRELVPPAPRWTAPADIPRRKLLEIMEYLVRLAILGFGAVFVATGLSGKAEASSWLLGGLYGGAELMKKALEAKPWGVWQQVGYAFFGLAVIFFAALPLPKVKTVPSAYFKSAFIDPLADYFKRFESVATLILVFICVYRVVEFLLNITSALYIDAGFTKAEIATATKVFGVVMLMIGTAMSAWGINKFGLLKCLVFGAFFQPLSHLPFIGICYFGNANIPFFEMLHIQPFLWAAVGFDNIASAFAGTCLIVYMSRLTKVGFTATQYALFSSLYALPGKLISAMSGRVVEGAATASHDGFMAFLTPLFTHVALGSFAIPAQKLGVSAQALASGYAMFFIYTILMGIFGVILAYMIASGKPKQLVEGHV